MTHQGVAAANPPFWWTFALGGIHLTMLSSEHDYSAGSAQRAFAEATLFGSGINRSLTPWSVVAFHRPMYSSDAGAYAAHSPGCELQVELEALLLAAKVDLVLTGHQHGYERIHPVRNGTVTDLPAATAGEACTRRRAPVHLWPGTAARRRKSSGWRRGQPGARADESGLHHTAPQKACGTPYQYTDTFGYVVAEAVNATHARFARDGEWPAGTRSGSSASRQQGLVRHTTPQSGSITRSARRRRPVFNHSSDHACSAVVRVTPPPAPPASIAPAAPLAAPALVDRSIQLSRARGRRPCRRRPASDRGGGRRRASARPSPCRRRRRRRAPPLRRRLRISSSSSRPSGTARGGARSASSSSVRL